MKDMKDEDLFPKVVGFIAVGAKRNGGHETTIVNTAMQMMSLGTIFVNDGHPVSQFGGICKAGLIGSDISDDSYGIKTSIGVGRRVSETAQILKAGKDRKSVV